MPTPVSAARQCLTADGARALDDAVAVARRRAHSQTTSLHAASALLALPSSLLRDACSRARSSAYSPRLQLRALELCFSVALDRLPSSQTLDEPPVSNSLMAAIKRSQANQRRNPDTAFNHHQHSFGQQSSPSAQTSSSSSSILLIKVELRHLVLSILDDPVVSRVFGEAGFRSTDIKLEIIRPPGPRFPRSRFPPLFLCNFAEPDVSDFDDNCQRICEVLVKNRNRNPFLIGVSAREAVRNFQSCVERSGTGPALPKELAGVKFLCVDKEVREGTLASRFDELGRLAAGTGVVIDVGDLKGFPDDGVGVAGLTKMLDIHREGRFWLLGSASNYETYMKFLTLHPALEKDWDLQLLPITSIKSGLGRLHPRPHSLMESFVPLGGFFSTVSELKGPLTGTCQPFTRCNICDMKYEQEVAAIGKVTTVPVPDQQHKGLPSWLKKTEIVGLKSGNDANKAKDDGAIQYSKIMGLQKKWNDICLRLHRSTQTLEPAHYRARPQFLSNVAYPYVMDQAESPSHQNMRDASTPPNQDSPRNEFPNSTDQQKILVSYQSLPIIVVPEHKNGNFLCKSIGRISKSEEVQKNCQRYELRASSDIGIGDRQASPSSVTSVTTDLILGTNYGPLKEPQKDPEICEERLTDLTGCADPAVQDVFQTKGSIGALKPQSLDCSDTSKEFDLRDFKSLWRTLTEMVGGQEAALCSISQRIAHCRAGNGRHQGGCLRGDIWLNFMGPDQVGQKNVALALADLMFGSRNKLISVDLSAQDCGNRSKSIIDFGQDISGYYSRGKTVVDYLAGEISRNRLSVVFLENVDKADFSLQNSLCRAVKTGKFPDSHGREIGVNNTVFVTTLRQVRSKTEYTLDCANFSEERVSAAQRWEMQIRIESSLEPVSDTSSNVLVTLCRRPTKENDSPSQISLKRKHEEFKMGQKAPNFPLDLNLSIEEMEAGVLECIDDDDCLSEGSEAWLQDFLDSVDETVEFKPFDFDALANCILKKIKEVFETSTRSKGSLEIDKKCMEQILAAAWVSHGTRYLNAWIETNLRSGFTEAWDRCKGLSSPVLKLVVCEERYMEEQAPGVCLPARIILT